MKRLLIKNGMNSFSKVKQHITSRLPNVWVFIIALMLSLGLGTAQAKDRISYFHSDISGSPIAATNDNGDVLWEESYKPYGERLDSTPNANKDQNNQWFTGKQEEADLGLQYFGARWYHQASGRFISRDPAGVLAHVESNPMMFNRYAYANNNPYKYVDPDGRNPELLFISDPQSYMESYVAPMLGVDANTRAGNAAITAHMQQEAFYGIAGGLLAGRLGKIGVGVSKVTRGGKPGSYRPDRALPRDKNGNPIPDSNAPHTQLGTKKGRNGDYTQAREFDANGKPVRDIDFTDHGRPQNHPNPHQHRYVPNDTGGTLRRLKDAESL